MITMIFRVVEGDSGRPVADAEVRVPYPEPEREYRTDAEGICEIEIPELEEERLTVLGRKEGFVPMRALWEISRTGSKLPGDYTLRLERGTRIAGTIRDDLGVPIEGVTVFLWIWMPKEVDGAQLNPDILNTTVVTDAQGRWSFEEGPAELPDVGYRFEHRDFVEELYLRKAEEPAGLRDGTAIWVMQRGLRVEGVVVDEDGRPIENAQILPGKDRMCSRSDGLIRTDASGKFSIPLKPGPESLTIKAEGFAPGLMQVDAGEAASPLRIALERGRVVRGRVVDDAGNALPGTHVFADTWRRHRTLAWLGVTDAEGKFLWDSAPPDEVLFDILRSGYGGRRRVPLVASNDEHRVVLLKPFRVGGTVRDAATGKAIELFRVIPGYTQQNGPINWLRKNAAEFTGGNYEREFKGDIMGERVLFLRIEAQGYLSGVARIEDSGRPTTVDFQLQPGPAAGGCLLKPDGVPAGDTTVVVVSGNPALLQGEKLDAGHGNMEVKTASDGTFWFPPQEPPYAIVAVHQEGCLFAMAEDLAREPILRLKAWGSLESSRTAPFRTTARSPSTCATRRKSFVRRPGARDGCRG